MTDEQQAKIVEATFRGELNRCVGEAKNSTGWWLKCDQPYLEWIVDPHNRFPAVFYSLCPWCSARHVSQWPMRRPSENLLLAKAYKATDEQAWLRL